MPTGESILHALPWVVFVRLAFGAFRCFTPDPIGRDPRSFLIVLSFWAMAIATGPLDPAPRWLVAVGVAGLIGSLGLFQWAAHTIRGRHFSYVFGTDTPEFLLTAGPYAWVRNPFYSSYLMAYGSSAAIFPGLVPLAIVAAMTVYFHAAARFEERKFEASALSAEYEQYRRRAGRFLPRVGAGRRPGRRPPARERPR